MFLVEGALPLPFLAPGAKLGLSNVVTLFALFRFGAAEAFLIFLARNFLSTVLLGSPTVLLFSLSGGLLSLAAMILLKRTGKFSIIGVSAAGGFFHNCGQIIAAVILLDSREVLNYLTVLGICGLGTGAAVGFVTGEILRRTD